MSTHPARPASRSNPEQKSDASGDARMSFGDHLEELRTCLIRAVLGVAIGTLASLFYGKEILAVIYRPLLLVQHANGLQPSLQVLSPTAGFIAYLKIGFLAGLIVTMPWVIFQLWQFVAIGLYPKERRFVKLLIPASTGLFALGVFFLYFIVLPIVLNFFVSFNRSFDLPDLTRTGFQSLLLPNTPDHVDAPTSGKRSVVPILAEDPTEPEIGEAWVNTTSRRFMINTDTGIWSAPLEPGASSPPMHSQFAIDFYVSFVLLLSLAFGIAFETPVVVFFLAHTGIVSPERMGRARRYVILGTVIAAAMLTPPDVVSQLLLAGPMYLLFELGLLVARLTLARRESPDDTRAS